MAGIGIAPHVVEAVLNHRNGTIKGVAAVYNRTPMPPKSAGPGQMGGACRCDRRGEG